MLVVANYLPLKLVVVVANNVLVAKVIAKDKEKKKVAKLQPSFFHILFWKTQKTLYSKNHFILIFYHIFLSCQGGFEKIFQKLLKN